MMVFTTEQWAKMKWSIEEDILTRHSDLRDIFKIISADFFKYDLTDIDTLVRYTILVYHKRSPMAQHISDIIQRKVEALEYLGIKKNKEGRFDEKIEQLIYAQSDIVAYTAIHFLKYENDRTWVKYCVNSELYWRTLAMTMKDAQAFGNKSPDDILKLQLDNKKKLTEIEKEMGIQEAAIFSDDNNLVNYVPSYLEEEKKWTIFPEDFVALNRKSEV